MLCLWVPVCERVHISSYRLVMDRKFVNKVLTPVFLSSFSSFSFSFSFGCCVYLLGANAVVLVVLISTCIIVFLFSSLHTCLTALLLHFFVLFLLLDLFVCVRARVCVFRRMKTKTMYSMFFSFFFLFALLSSPLIFYTYLFKIHTQQSIQNNKELTLHLRLNPLIELLDLLRARVRVNEPVSVLTVR